MWTNVCKHFFSLFRSLIKDKKKSLIPSHHCWISLCFKFRTTTIEYRFLFFFLLRHYLQIGIIFYFFPSSSYRRSSVFSVHVMIVYFRFIIISWHRHHIISSKWLIIFDSSNYIIHFMQRLMFDVRECVVLVFDFNSVFVVAIFSKTKQKSFWKIYV